MSEGCSLSEVHKQLAEEYDISLTYLDLRLIAAELEVDWQKQDQKKQEEAKAEAAKDLSQQPEEPAAPAGGTTVTVSKVVRPGASISGDVQFASGAKAEWFVDAMGRLGLNPEPGSSKPTEDDLREFQMELQRKLSG